MVDRWLLMGGGCSWEVVEHGGSMFNTAFDFIIFSTMIEPMMMAAKSFK